MVGAIFLYVLNSYTVVSDLQQAWASIPEYAGSDMNASFQLQIGFYCGLITVGLIFGDIAAQNVPYLKIGTPSNQYGLYEPQHRSGYYGAEVYGVQTQPIPSELYCLKCGFLN